MKYCKICRVKCLRCGDVLEHTNRTKTDRLGFVMWCRCGKVGLDPAAAAYRILGKPEDYLDLGYRHRRDTPPGVSADTVPWKRTPEDGCPYIRGRRYCTMKTDT